jgi:hypothetical protein
MECAYRNNLLNRSIDSNSVKTISAHLSAIILVALLRDGLAHARSVDDVRRKISERREALETVFAAALVARVCRRSRQLLLTAIARVL